MTFIGWLSTLENFIETARLVEVSSLARSLALPNSQQKPEHKPLLRASITWLIAKSVQALLG